MLRLTSCFLLFAALAFGRTTATADASSPVLFGEAEPFNDGWLFSLSDPADAAAPAFDDDKWRQLDLPHDWSIEGTLSPTLASCTGYLPGGIAWYRKHFIHSPRFATDGGKGKGTEKHYLYFEGIYNRSEIYLNGHLLGKRPNGYVSFCYDLTPYLQEGENILAVRVDHSRHADSRWYTGSGIYRNVWLVRAPETHLAQWGTTYRLTAIDARTAEIEVESAIESPTKLIRSTAAAGHPAKAPRPLQIAVTIYDRNDRPVARKTVRLAAAQTKITAPLTIPKPHRWELADPYLYTMQVDLLDGGKRIDGCRTRIGLRTLEFDPDKGFALNGRWMKVKGVCLHHDAGTLGAAVPPEVWRRRLENLKTIGVNAIRMSHNPQAPALYDLCDELGLLVMDEASDEWEFPKRKWLAGWNEGTPGYDGTYDFFEEWIERDVADMVRRDRNHPSIFLWSIGNEVDYPNDPYSHPVLDSIRITQK
ncbi:MAG: glycoside hydrolase family 2, partial [Alistipes sp.]|nr:glycoside hydrolase family 2 [Alistipes sp.]